MRGDGGLRNGARWLVAAALATVTLTATPLSEQQRACAATLRSITPTERPLPR